MNQKITYLFVLGATLSLSFCNRTPQSSLYDPNNGANAASAQQLLNTAPPPSYTSQDTVRRQTYSFPIPTDQQITECLADHKAGLALTEFCGVAIRYMMIGGFSRNFEQNNNIQNPLTVNFGVNGSQSVELDWQSMFRDQAYVPAFNQNFDTNYPNFQTGVNMQDFCNDPTRITRIQYSNPCSTINASYARINLDRSIGLNYMQRGMFDRAQPCFSNGCTGVVGTTSPCAATGGRNCGGTRGVSTVLGSRNVALENTVYRKQLATNWKNLKGLPANVALQAGIRGTDVVASVVANVSERLNLGLSRISARNYSRAEMSREQIAYYDQISAIYADACRDAQYTQLVTVQPDSPCDAKKYHYEVFDGSSPSNGYSVDEDSRQTNGYEVSACD